MQRGEVAVAKAYASPSNQFDDTERNQFTEMPERWTPPPPRSPPLPDDDEQDRPFEHRPYRGSRHNNNYNKHRKPRPTPQQSPCMKFVTGYGCSYGDKCRFSHDIRPLYPTYYDYGPIGYEDPFWTARTPRQYYPQRQMPLPPPMPKSDPVRRSSFDAPPQRERASSLMSYSKSHDNPTDGVPVSPSGELMFKEAVLRQSKMKQSNQREPAQRKTETSGYGDENRHTNRELSPPENVQLQLPLPKQYPRRKKNLRGRKCASGESAPNSVNGDSPKLLCLSSNELFSEVGDVDPIHVDTAQQLPRAQQKNYPLPASASQLLNSVSPPYPPYATEEKLHSNLSRQAEDFVDYIDTQLASMEMHQQQAIDALQELVCSLWPDAIIDVYGSSYTRLALPVSDIDCVLVARSLMGERPLTILEALAAEVERQPWTKNLELLGSAKIPVLKMTYAHDPTQKGVLLDLTCGHSVGHTGLGARDLIYSFQAEMPALRPLVLILKSHLVSNDLNCAFTGGMSSYVLVILAIRFFQACGDIHQKSFASTNPRKVRGGSRRRSYSDNASVEEVAFALNTTDTMQPKWCYTFSRDGRVTWRTGIGSLVMLFLETYITFDYRRFGISISNEGEYFLLPPDKVVAMQCSAVIPYVADPIKPGRSICNCFRMHEVIQSWLSLYQNLAAGAPLTFCVSGGSSR